MKRLLVVCILLSLSVSGQTLSDDYNNYGQLIYYHMDTAPFPHPERAEGHTYGDTLYSANDHYKNDLVAIFIPKGYQQTKKVDIVIHFHGWWNCVDSVLTTFKLIEQFAESNKNAILVVPQGPYKAPDSFGGKLEDKDGFENFITDLLGRLHSDNYLTSEKLGNIILSGHSGGYHVIAYILLRGGLQKNIKEVYLFDGLYGQVEKYCYWLDDYNGKLIDIYTEHGGTKSESESLMEDFQAWGTPYKNVDESQLNKQILQNSRIIFIYSKDEHNDVIHLRNNFQRFLSASLLKDR